MNAILYKLDRRHPESTNIRMALTQYHRAAHTKGCPPKAVIFHPDQLPKKTDWIKKLFEIEVVAGDVPEGHIRISDELPSSPLGGNAYGPPASEGGLEGGQVAQQSMAEATR